MVHSNDLPKGPLFDRRLTPARPDLAAATLSGKVEAARFVEGWRRRIILGAAPLRRSPSHKASLDTEALYGETVIVYEEQDGWAWGQLERDGYVGYLPAAALGAPAEPDHRLAVPRSFAYPGPSIKLPPLLALSLGARFAVRAREGDFAVNAEGLHVYFPHLAPLAAVANDFVAIAERFLEVPYLWGGRTSQGVDCSGLVQTALSEAGIDAPRDSDMMEAALGAPIAFDEAALADLRRGDLVFWKGHVGIMRDAEALLHANGYAMRVVSEPLRAAIERTKDPITSIRRL
jgi:Bacterial dipeptidyl-peptidase Sh3 domain/NlpC/P60 family